MEDEKGRLQLNVGWRGRVVGYVVGFLAGGRGVADLTLKFQFTRDLNDGLECRHNARLWSESVPT